MAKKLDYKEKSPEELSKMLAEKREELRTLRFSSVSRSVKDTNDPRKMRADIARIFTEMHARRVQPQALTELGARAKKTAAE